MLIVHHLSHSRSEKILWLMEELNVAYQLKMYMRDPETLSAPAEMKALHPLGTSPLITDNGETFAETGAIIDYILRHYGNGNLQPAVDTLGYDRFIEWLHYAEGSAFLPILMAIYSDYTGAKSPTLDTLLMAQLSKHLGYIENALEGHDYLVGDTFSAADIHVSFVAQTANNYTDMTIYPNTLAWLERLHSRVAFKKAESKGGYFGAAKPEG